MKRCAPQILAAAALMASACPAPAEAQFADRSVPSGLAWFQLTWGAALADLDLDGDLDLYSGHHYYAPILWWNDGTGVFDRFLHPAPWQGDVDRHGVLVVSLDDDTRPELFVTHGADGGLGVEKNELYRNDGGGSFAFVGGAGGMADLEGRGRAASAADVDGDGLLDVWIGKAPDAASPNSLFRNDGDLQFTDVAAAVGLDEILGTAGGLFGDIDDDGDPDLLVGGEEFARPTNLFRNDGGSFVDASAAFSPPLPILSGADFGDFDNDGDLDLAAVDGEVALFDTWSEGDSVAFFFNTRWGDTGIDGLTIPSAADTAWATLKLRGLYDPSRVFLGPAETTAPLFPPIALTDAYVGAPAFTPGVDRGIWVWRASPGGPWEIRCSTPSVNFDAFDGWWTDGTPVAGTVAHDLEPYTFTPSGPRVWRNDGGSFVEVTVSLGLPLMSNPQDVSWVDFDNDADLDLHVVDAGTSANPNAPDALLRNDGAAFTDVTGAEGLAGSATGMGDGGVWGDIDGDLDVDLYLQEGTGPFAFSESGPARLYRNEGARGGALLLDLVLYPGGPPAVGARVAAHCGATVVQRRVGASSWRGFQDPVRVHVGLAGANACDSLVVTWPDGAAETYPALVAGHHAFAPGGATAAPIPQRGRDVAPWRIAALFPQPATGAQTVVLELIRAADLEVALFDVGGRRVSTWHRGPLQPGSHAIRAPSDPPLPGGVYFLRVSDGARLESGRALRIR